MAVETRIFDDGVLSGIRSWFHYDHADDTIRIETEVPSYVAPIVDASHEAFKAVDKGPRPFSGKEPHELGFHIANVPMTLITQWMKEGIINDGKEIKRRLNDPVLAPLRTHPGKL